MTTLQHNLSKARLERSERIKKAKEKEAAMVYNWDCGTSESNCQSWEIDYEARLQKEMDDDDIVRRSRRLPILQDHESNIIKELGYSGPLSEHCGFGMKIEEEFDKLQKKMLENEKDSMEELSDKIAQTVNILEEIKLIIQMPPSYAQQERLLALNSACDLDAIIKKLTGLQYPLLDQVPDPALWQYFCT